MKTPSRIGQVTGGLTAGIGVALAAYGAYVMWTWARYGRLPHAVREERDVLLDRFMPTYEVVERHRIAVRAPAGVALAAARDQNLFELPLVRAIFRTRELVLRATPDPRPRPRGLLAAAEALGWGVLAEIPDREIVLGAVTRPWEPDVTFTALSPADFAASSPVGSVKIAWTLRADPVDDQRSIFRTETRACATDAAARARFRRYWACASPGIALIRRLSLPPLRRDAERRAAIERRASNDLAPSDPARGLASPGVPR